MKNLLTVGLSLFALVLVVQACGPSEEELRQREQARLDSLERVQMQRLEQARIDSIAQAQRALEEARRLEEERRTIAYDDMGAFSVQIGSWRSEEKAAEMVDYWKSHGFSHSYYVKFGSEETGDVWFRVRLGNVATLDEAHKLQSLVREDHDRTTWVDRVR